MLDRLGNEVDFTELFMEEALSAKDKKELPDSMYGLVYTDENGKKIRKFPLNDESHVRQAAIFFDRAKGLSEDQKRTLARNIVRRAKELDMDYSGWESLKPYLDKSVKESFMTYEWLMKQNYPDPDSTSGTSEFDDSDNEPDDCYTESFEEMFGYILQETYQPYDEYLKLHQYDPKTNTIVINGKRMNAGIMGSNKQRNRMNKFLRENNYNPKDGTIETSIDENGTKRRVEFNINPHDGGSMNRYAIIDNQTGETKRKDFDINMSPKSISGKPGISNQTKEHETGHGDIYLHPEKYEKQLQDSDKHNQTKKAVGNYRGGNPDQVRHAMDPEENVADLYATKNNKYGQSWKDSDYGKMIEDERRSRVKDQYQDIKKNKELNQKRYQRYVDKEREDGGLSKDDEDAKNFYERMANAKPNHKAIINNAANGASMRSYKNEINSRKEFVDNNLNNDQQNTQNQSQDTSSPPPIKESFEEMFGPVIQEAFDVITGEEIPIEKAYTMDEMKERTFSDKELKNSKKEIKEYFKLAKEIVKRISKQVEKDAKPPTGNQNCLLCTWCAEAGFRGMNALPRPVYSPCDPIFEVIGENIVREPERIPLRGFDNLMEHLMDAQKPFARFYAHVNWIESKGGHEFLILKISANECYVVDAQQGDVEPLTDVHKYFVEINWDNSYICRLDNKNFNNRLFEIMNDPKKTLSWDPKRDIPYMLREGMITKEEAEREFKAAETNTFYKELKKALGQTPIQEGAWNDIRNGVNPWSMKRVFHISPEGHLDGQIFKPRVPEYLDKYDPSKTEFEDAETPRVCFSPSIDGCLNAILVNIGRWKTANKLRDWYVYIPEKPLKEYKYRTNKQLVDEKKVYDANLTKEIWIEEPVRLKQYGIIRIDSVTDVNRKKAVPTTLGESKKRNVYDFKWHWLVKPKVIKDVPYDYSPKEVCKDMVDEGYNFKYGLGYDGSIHHGSSKDFDEKYRLESPEEFEKNGGGICYDFVEWQAGYLEAYGYTCRKFFISTDTEDNMTHTFILVDGGNGEFIYPEISFELLQGVHEVKSPEEAALKVMDKIFDVNDNGKKYDEIKYYVWEYEGHPPYGSDMETCHKYFSKGEPFHEGTAKKLK